MGKYYTRACNFYYGLVSAEKVKKKLSLPLHGNKLISFDMVEIISRKNIKKISIQKVNKLKIQKRKKILSDIKQITKKKIFKGLNFSNLPILMGILNLTPNSFSDGGKFNKKKTW